MNDQQPSELALRVGSLVRNGGLVDELSAAQIHEALAHHLAWNPIGERYELLKVLTSMMMVAGEIPTQNAYEEERLRRGEGTPASTLSDAYGGWLGATRAAVRSLAGLRAKRRVEAHPHRRRPYSTKEVIDAILVCRAELEYWPLAGEFFLWRQIKRRLAREMGREHLRIPCREALRKHFTTFDDALVEAKLTFERRQNASGPKKPRRRR
jgi:hypothetical protein